MLYIIYCLKNVHFLKPFLYFRILKKQIQLNTAILEKCIQMKQNLFTWRKLEKMEITHRKKEDYPTISAYEVVFFELNMFFVLISTHHIVVVRYSSHQFRHRGVWVVDLSGFVMGSRTTLVD